MHKHHILPKRLGGSDDQENLTPPISLELHAEFHKDLWDYYGHWGDYIAWRALSGRMTGEEARLAAALEGQKDSDKYKNRSLREHLNSVRTKDTCSIGGKAAIPSLLKWQKENKEAHSKACSENGKLNAIRNLIPHKYKGVVYPSKNALHAETGLSNCGFYGKLKRGEITRLEKIKLSKIEKLT